MNTRLKRPLRMWQEYGDEAKFCTRVQPGAAETIAMSQSEIRRRCPPEFSACYMWANSVEQSVCESVTCMQRVRAYRLWGQAGFLYLSPHRAVLMIVLCQI